MPTIWRRDFVQAGLAVALAACWAARGLSAQGPASPPPAPLLERLTGRWTMTGTVRQEPVTYRLDAAWTLQRRFVELHMRDVRHTPPQYEARVFVGPDTAAGRVIAHWLDNFGAAYSVPPAAGAVRGDTLVLDFPYPDGAFHDVFAYDRAADAWTVTLDAADGHGGWARFAEYRVSRR
jgi:hypothetical protein